MRVFISWSGERSRAIGQALRDWLPLVLHYVQPWLSAADIDAGQRWATEVGQQLNDSSFGILCLTRDNLQSLWILFEAGALAKSVAAGAVVPYLYDLEFSDVTGPLAQFQAKKADAESTLELVTAINNRFAQPIPSDRLQELFALVWPRLQNALAAVPAAGSQFQPARSQREVLEELVQVVRTVERRTRSLEPPTSNVEDPALQSDWESEARNLVTSRRKVDAIKLVIKATGLGLKEAKEIVDSWNIPREPLWEKEARACLKAGETVSAVKIIRQATGLGLREALDLAHSWR